MRQVLTIDKAGDLRSLIRVLTQIAEYANDFDASEIYLDATVRLIQNTLTDGSKTYDIEIAEA
jgi:hypothetical protein